MKNLSVIIVGIVFIILCCCIVISLNDPSTINNLMYYSTNPHNPRNQVSNHSNLFGITNASSTSSKDLNKNKINKQASRIHKSYLLGDDNSLPYDNDR
tara:strand:+ start:367 stop:660 length:294 start_codon:yes stop_codon:yes gene_type:complete